MTRIASAARKSIQVLIAYEIGMVQLVLVLSITTKELLNIRSRFHMQTTIHTDLSLLKKHPYGFSLHKFVRIYIFTPNLHLLQNQQPATSQEISMRDFGTIKSTKHRNKFMSSCSRVNPSNHFMQRPKFQPSTSEGVV